MPCGTGKSLTAYWITQTLGSKATIIAVPSLALIKQSLEDWTKEMVLSKPNELPDWCCICSDESTGQLTDDFVTDTYSLGIPTTTNDNEIASFLKRKNPGGKIIFTTYQSADKLAQVSKKLKFKFDLAILDEAHKTVGAKEKAFSILLQEDKISIGKRLFMTATERIVKGAEDEILSMDDDNVYGKVFYKLSFKKAIEDGIITDYKIVTVLVNDTEIQDLIKKNKYITDQNKKVDEAEAQMLTTAIALKKAIKEYDLKHTVSFHKSINASKEFQSLYQKIDTTKDSPTVFHISSKLNAGSRAELLKDFRNTSSAIITNARCLTEGVDVPAIDCVLFADQKQSVVDIVQASGRALRQYTDKNTGVKKDFGYIIIPVVLKEGESLDDLTESSRFKTVARIVASLSTQDETIAEELKLIDAGKQKTGSGKIQAIGSVNKSIKLDLNTFSQRINTKIWERIAKVNWMPFKEAREFVSKIGLINEEEWQQYCKDRQKPKDIPNAPSNVYRESGWKSWGDWLGTGFIANGLKEFLPFENAKKIVVTLGLKGQRDWREYCLSLQKPINIPSNPEKLYKDCGWAGYGDWLGTKNVRAGSVIFLEFEEARKYVRNLKLNSKSEWEDFYNSGNKPNNIPSVPRIVYKSKGWLGMGDWLGTDRVASIDKVYRDFKSARDYVRSLNLKSQVEWFKFCEEGEKPNDIPRKADRTYKNQGWKGFGDWLGNNKIANQDKVYKSFKEAKSFVIKLKLNGQKEWYEYCKSGNKPNDIPRNPYQTYKKKGWIGFGDWLGNGRLATKDREYLSFEKAKEYVRNLNLKNTIEWNERFRNNLIRLYSPGASDRIYKIKGWKGWKDFLGK